MFFKSKKVVALDIGSSSIKLVELEHGRKGVSITRYGQWPTPPNCIQSGEILDMNALANAIKSLMIESGSKRKNTAVGMWGTSVIVKRISIPKIDVSMVAEQIKWEAEQYIPFDINEISLAHHILPGTDPNSETMDILLVAAKQDQVLQFSEVITASGLKPTIVDVSGFALANCFEANYGVVQESVALLNIGSSVTNFVVLDRGEVAFSRDIPVGGANYVNEINKEMGVSIEEAEALKLSASSNLEVPQDVHSLINSTNEAISEEIQNSFEFYLATSSNSKISRLFFSGGSLSVPNLLEKISSSARIPFEILNPFQGLEMKISPKVLDSEAVESIKPFAAIAVGLGLRQIGDKA